MKNFYILKYDSENLGDDIQSIATMDILDEMQIKYQEIYRDLINGCFFNPFDENYIILNGWFTNGYGVDQYYSVIEENRKYINVTWPPQGNFKPILYSFHISEWGPVSNREVHPNFLDRSAEFYKLNGTVGCRDEHTFNIMKKLNVDAYFSGCITLTLNKDKYIKNNSIKNEVLFVDIPNLYKEKLILKANEYYCGGVNFKSLTHSISIYSKDIIDRFTLARRHLEAFCNAKLVFTSRLHVALPCLALGTPVIFVSNKEDLVNSRIVDYTKYLNIITHDQIDNTNLCDLMHSKYDKVISDNIKSKFKEIISNL